LSGQDVAFEDGLLTFLLLVEDQKERDVELRFEGHVVGETLSGTLLMMPNRGEIAVVGRRRPR